MKRPGLTESMRRALEQFRIGRYDTDATFRRAFDDGFCDHSANLTPRGQAALAAPRVTAAELAMLERTERGEWMPVSVMSGRVYCVLWSRRWIDPDETIGATLTPAGTTALNNIRAASGSPEWKEVP